MGRKKRKIRHKPKRSPEELLTEILDSIMLEVSGIHMILLVTNGGHLIASMPSEIGDDEFILSAMTAALINTAEQASIKLDKGKPKELIVECPMGLIILKRITEEVLVVVVTEEGIRVEGLRPALSEAQSKICQILNQHSVSIID